MTLVAEQLPRIRGPETARVHDSLRVLSGEVDVESLFAPWPSSAGPAGGTVGSAQSTTPDPDESAPRASLACPRFVRTAAPLLASDLLSLLLCGALAVCALRLIHPAWGAQVGWLMPLALLPLVLAYWPAGLYPGIGLHPVVELRQVTKVGGIALLAATLSRLLTAGGAAHAAFFAAAWLASLPLVPFSRILVRKLCAKRLWWGYPALIVSCGATAEAVARVLVMSPHSGLRPAASLDPTGETRAQDRSLPALDLRSVDRFIRDHRIRHAVLSLPDLSRDQVARLLEFFSGRIPHLMLVSNLSDLPTLWNTSRSCGALNGMELRNGLMLAVPRAMKRAIDLALTSAALACSLPLFVGVGLLIKLTSRGSVFYGHKRIGLQGRKFKAWKFRSMYCDGDRILKEHLEANPAARVEWERDQKLRDDPRVTPVGGILRRLSLDELPQLWNVLTGDMSLVGPRPIVDAEVEKYGKVFPLVKGVKPGITGLWQVSGRNDTTYGQRVNLDQYYVRNWSPWLDVYILAKTVAVVLNRRGAY
jgi:Undecaprenyl-phosphate galactose phosphotransferase WbaP